MRRKREEEREDRDSRGRIEKTRASRERAALLLFCGSAPPTDVKYTAYGNLVSRLRIPELSASEFLVALFCDFTLEL